MTDDPREWTGIDFAAAMSWNRAEDKRFECDIEERQRFYRKLWLRRILRHLRASTGSPRSIERGEAEP